MPAYYIKLGAKGEWEEDCLREGNLHFGYREATHALCKAGKWDRVWKEMRAIRTSDSAATSDVRQIKIFYEADEQAIFITFHGGLLHWCKPAGPVQLLADGTRMRPTVMWSSKSENGTPLLSDRLSGQLLKVQMYRGTICAVHAHDYLLRKLSDTLSPQIEAAENKEAAFLTSIEELMRLLTWQDFELLVELVFSNSGWQRVSQFGGTSKTVDAELKLPITSERAFIQVKSKATLKDFEEYEARFQSTEAFDRMFFVWHTGNLSEDLVREGIVMIGPKKLSRLVLDAGLSSWLREKVS